jgi:cytochrome c553
MRWIRYGLAVLAGIIVLALATVYVGSEWIIRSSHAVPVADVAIPTDAASIAEGARMARIASCRECHGANGQGRVLFEAPMVGRVASPSLARMAATMTDAELVRAIRQGVHKDGRSIFVMPTHALGHIADEDVARIVAWIRTLKPGPQDSTATMQLGPVGRVLVLTGKLPVMASPAKLAEARRPADRGRYYADIACLACHKLAVAGTMEDGKTVVPPLAPMAASYDADKFRRLLHTGVGASRADLGIMSAVARESFSALTDEEVAAIQAYLKREAAKLGAQ